MRQSANTYENARSFAFIIFNCMFASPVYFDFSHLWLSPPLPTAQKKKKHPRRALAHAPTQSHVINSITHTPVNANEAKTNPFLLIVCLRF